MKPPYLFAKGLFIAYYHSVCQPSSIDFPVANETTVFNLPIDYSMPTTTQFASLVLVIDY